MPKVVFHQRLSSNEGCLLPKVVFYRRSSSTVGRLPLKVVFHRRSSSFKGFLPPKVILHRRLSSTEGCLLPKVIFHRRLSPSKGCLPPKDIQGGGTHPQCIRRVQKYYGKQWRRVRQGGKMSQKCPNFTIFGIVAIIYQDTKRKFICIIFQSMCVELEKDLKGYVSWIFKMVKIDKIAIKWPKLNIGNFSLKNCFLYLLMIAN